MNGSFSISVQQLVDGAADEQLLALDAPEVGGAVDVPLAVLPLLVVAAAGVGEGLRPVDVGAAGVEAQPGVGVLGRDVRAHLDPADLVDELLEAGEVDLHVVVDRDAEGLGDGGDEALRALVVGRVDLASCGRSRRSAPTGRAGSDSRAAPPLRSRRSTMIVSLRLLDDLVGAADGAGVGIVGGDALAGVRADEQVVLGRRVVDRRLQRLHDLGSRADRLGALIGRHLHPDRAGGSRRGRRARARARPADVATGFQAWADEATGGHPPSRAHVPPGTLELPAHAGGLTSGAGAPRRRPRSGGSRRTRRARRGGRRARRRSPCPRRPRRELDAHASPERPERGAVVGGDVGRQAVVGGEQRAEHVARRHVVAQPGGTVGSPADVEAEPDDDVAGRRALGEDAGQLALVDEQVVGPLQADVDAGELAGTRRPRRGRRAGSARSGAVGHVVEQHRHQQVGAGRGVPPPVEPAPAGRLVVGDEHAAVGPAGGRRRAGRRSCSPVSATCSTVQPGGHAGPGALEPRSVHGTYIGSRAEEDPDRQPGRDRRARDPRRPRARHRHRGGVLRARPRRAARAARRRGVRARRPDRGRELPQHRGDPRRHPPERRRRRAPRLRVLQRERRLRPGDHRHGRGVHRAAARGHRGDGRQGVEPQGRPARRRADRARHHRVRPERRRDPRLRRGATAGRSPSRPRSAAAAAA